MRAANIREVRPLSFHPFRNSISTPSTSPSFFSVYCGCPYSYRLLGTWFFVLDESDRRCSRSLLSVTFSSQADRTSVESYFSISCDVSRRSCRRVKPPHVHAVCFDRSRSDLWFLCNRRPANSEALHDCVDAHKITSSAGSATTSPPPSRGNIRIYHRPQRPRAKRQLSHYRNR